MSDQQTDRRGWPLWTLALLLAVAAGLPATARAQDDSDDTPAADTDDAEALDAPVAETGGDEAATLEYLIAIETRARDASGRPLPKHVNQRAVDAIDRGLAYLANTQGADGSWRSARDGMNYPVSMTAMATMAFLCHGNTPSRGEYADTVKRAIRWIIRQQQTEGQWAGLIHGQGRGQPMYGHGFSLLLLASAYGMETDERWRQRMKPVIEKAIDVTAKSQSNLGGWTYSPGAGDEGSVTITQMQALRAAHNAGFTVPKATIEKAIKYLEKCKTPEGGIKYSFSSGPRTRLPISAAAITCLYSAGEYESPLAEQCLRYVWGQFKNRSNQWSKGGGHDYYAHHYAAQAFYQAGDKYWDAYFPTARDQVIGLQQADGSWNGDHIGPTYGTAIALTILQLPYKFLPIYQR